MWLCVCVCVHASGGGCLGKRSKYIVSFKWCPLIPDWKCWSCTYGRTQSQRMEVLAGVGMFHSWRNWGPERGVCLGHTVRDSMVGTKISPLGSQFSGLVMVPWGFSSVCLLPSHCACLKLSPPGFYTSGDIRSFPHFPAISWGTWSSCLPRGLQVMLTLCSCPSCNHLTQEPRFHLQDVRQLFMSLILQAWALASLSLPPLRIAPWVAWINIFCLHRLLAVIPHLHSLICHFHIFSP